MRPRLITLLALMVVVPLAMVTWLGARAAAADAEQRERRLAALLEGRLRDVEARVVGVIEERAAALVRELDGLDPFDADALRAWQRRAPAVDQVFVLAGDGRLLHPPLAGPLAAAELDFLHRCRRLFEEGLLLAATRSGADAAARQMAGEAPPAAAAHGWYSWYWDSGLHLLFWTRRDTGVVVGCELNRVRVVADVLTELADLAVGAGDAIVLLDGQGRTLERWGGGDEAAVARVEIALQPPLAAWRLAYLRPPEDAAPLAVVAWRWAALAVMTVALAGLGVLFYRESTRELREAAQRVSFVNQVSHELRTPLTNIRLYAELLLERHQDDAEIRAPLEIVVAESQRLSRLIGNVLSFARRERGELRVRPRPGDLAATVAAALERFRPALAARGVAVELAAAGEVLVDHDPDAVEQVVANLLSNVEKYAAAGGWVRVAVEPGEAQVVVVVEDRGPGIPAARADDVFRPFVRLSSALTEGVAGTGIGLALARDLARLHGGDLVLAPSAVGARFELVLPSGGRGGRA